MVCSLLSGMRREACADGMPAAVFPASLSACANPNPNLAQIPKHPSPFPHPRIHPPRKRLLKHRIPRPITVRKMQTPGAWSGQGLEAFAVDQRWALGAVGGLADAARHGLGAGAGDVHRVALAPGLDVAGFLVNVGVCAGQGWPGFGCAQLPSLGQAFVGGRCWRRAGWRQAG